MTDWSRAIYQIIHELEEVQKTQIASDSVIAVVKQQSGYHSGLVLTDASANKIVVITLWETEAHMKARVNNGFVQQQVAKIAPHLEVDFIHLKL